MPFKDRCLRWQLAVLAIATSWLSGCATAGSEWVGQGACPPVVEYSRAEQVGVAEEVAELPEGMLIIGWLADYAVMREQVRSCGVS